MCDSFKSAFARSIVSTRESATESQDNEDQRVMEMEVIRLRKECQSLVEENRRLNGNPSQKTNENVENFLLQSQIDTLQWQLKQMESSRLMYRELLEEMVNFLTRTHQTLSERQLKSTQPLKRAHSTAQLWRKPSENLASDALRLLHTTKSLLNTTESDDLFLAQLAREFPSKNNNTSISSSDESGFSSINSYGVPIEKSDSDGKLLWLKRDNVLWV